VISLFRCCNRLLSQKLHELKDKIQDAVVNRVVEDFVDIVSPLKYFTEAVHLPEGWKTVRIPYIYVLYVFMFG
jgi:hypothetical protein